MFSGCLLNAEFSSSIAHTNSSERSGAAITFAHRAAIRSLISISIGGGRAVGCQTNPASGIQENIHHHRVGADCTFVGLIFCDVPVARAESSGGLVSHPRGVKDESRCANNLVPTRSQMARRMGHSARRLC